MIEMLKDSVEWLLERYDVDELPVRVMIEAIERLAGCKVEIEAEKDYVWRDGEEVEIVKWVWRKVRSENDGYGWLTAREKCP